MLSVNITSASPVLVPDVILIPDLVMLAYVTISLSLIPATLKFPKLKPLIMPPPFPVCGSKQSDLGKTLSDTKTEVKLYIASPYWGLATVIVVVLSLRDDIINFLSSILQLATVSSATLQVKLS